MTQRTCRVCDAPVVGRQHSAVYCSWKCREVWRYQQKRLRKDPTYTPRARQADVCTHDGCDRAPWAKDLCLTHYKAKARGEGVAWALLGGGPTGHRARARHHGVPYEPIDTLAIYERDAWTCGICSLPVDRALAYPDPMSVSLDHVLPIARGGGHVPDNVQCAHLICNTRKSDTVAA